MILVPFAWLFYSNQSALNHAIIFFAVLALTKLLTLTIINVVHSAAKDLLTLINYFYNKKTRIFKKNTQIKQK